MREKNYVMNQEDFQQMMPVFRTAWGTVLLKFLMKIVGIKRINELYAHSCDKEGTAFTASILRELQVTYTIDRRQILEQLPAGGFITVSNHPYGALDGIILIDLIASKRSDYRVMVNKILENVTSMSNHFIGVVPPSGSTQIDSRSMSGLKAAMRHIREGHPLGFFPAGAVARYDWRLCVSEQSWQSSVIRFIQRAKVPVIPIYFHGHSSALYNSIGLLSWRLRSLRLPKEIFNKKGKTFRVSIGDPILPVELEKFDKVADLSRFLKKRTLEIGQKKKQNRKYRIYL